MIPSCILRWLMLNEGWVVWLVTRGNSLWSHQACQVSTIYLHPHQVRLDQYAQLLGHGPGLSLLLELLDRCYIKNSLKAPLALAALAFTLSVHTFPYSVTTVTVPYEIFAFSKQHK